MTPLNILQGDWIEQLRTMLEQSVHCCVTSPPYWGLRDYGVAGQLGLEQTVEEYVAKLTLGFREVWRVLRNDGTLWLNLGDTYSGGGKAKSLLGVPWRVALALQADGWCLRTEIIWHKPNPMPESVRDRPTRAHEYIFLLTKRPKYFYDAAAIHEPCSLNTHKRISQDLEKQIGSLRAYGGTARPMKAVVAGVSPKAKLPGVNSRFYRNRDARHSAAPKIKNNESFSAAVCCQVLTRNRRSVWTIGSKPYRGAHFATFPPALVEPCIMAGTSEHGCCPACGAPWKRVISQGAPNLAQQRASGGDVNGEYHGSATKAFLNNKAQDASAVKARILKGMRDKVTVGWAPGCGCARPDVVPCTVLDPFGGSFTTAEVAQRLGRAAVMIELNPAYIELGKQRCAA